MKINGMSMSEFIKSQINNGTEVIERNTGSMSITDGQVVCNGSVVIRRGNKRVVLKGNSIVKKDGVWYVDGKKADTSSLDMTEYDTVNIEITGDVTNLSTTTGNVVINGSCVSLQTASGDVKCSYALSVNTGSGDVRCDKITGSVSTCSGDIYRG